MRVEENSNSETELRKKISTRAKFLLTKVPNQDNIID